MRRADRHAIEQSRLPSAPDRMEWSRPAAASAGCTLNPGQRRAIITEAERTARMPELSPSTNSRLWTRSAATRVGGTRFRARTLFQCRRTELRPTRSVPPPRRREGKAQREPPAHLRPHGAGLCQQHGATPSLYLMGCRTGGKSFRRQVTELGRDWNGTDCRTTQDHGLPLGRAW